MARIFGAAGRIGMVVPANNATLEPELWPRLPDGISLYCTKILARGDLTPEAVHRMETHFDRAVDELVATGVDVIVYADMVTTFIMAPNWNAERTGTVSARTGVRCFSAWMALDAALAALGVKRVAIGTPYPAAVHSDVRPFFEEAGYEVVDDRTLDIVSMSRVPEVTGAELRDFVTRIDFGGAEALVLLATDLPTLDEIEALEAEIGLPVLTSNQTLLWRALRTCGFSASLPRLGRLFDLA